MNCSHRLVGLTQPDAAERIEKELCEIHPVDNVFAASAIASSFSQAHTSLQSAFAVTASVDEFMSQLANSLSVAPISMSKVPSTPLSSRTHLAEYQSIDLALADDGLNNSLYTMANDLLLSMLR